MVHRIWHGWRIEASCGGDRFGGGGYNLILPLSGCPLESLPGQSWIVQPLTDVKCVVCRVP